MTKPSSREFVIVDLETTGGAHVENHITEIGMVRYKNGEIVDSYETLINPERPIPPFIARLTGITDDMVADAPTFLNKADEIAEFIGDAIFVAHNVGFDYNFLKKEFKTIGRDFNQKRLCTVRLSRKIMPGLPSYSLGKLCNSLGISIKNRHRALGDAMATAKLFHLIAGYDENNFIEKSLNARSKEAVLPPHLSKSVFESLPRSTGVYFFRDNKGKVIYVGKAKNIQKRALDHFRSATKKELEMRPLIHDVDYEETGSELFALIRECQEIKKLWPAFNSTNKRYGSYWGIFFYEAQDGYGRLVVDKVRRGSNPLKIFISIWKAREYLWQLVREQELCAKFSGLVEDCGLAHGVLGKEISKNCACNEAVDHYNKRVEEARYATELSAPTCIIMEKGRTRFEKILIWIEQGEYRGAAYIEQNLLEQEDYHTLTSYIQPALHFPELRTIIEGYLASKKRAPVIEESHLSR